MDRVYVMQLVRSFQCGYMTRREFVRRTALAVGSLAAANALLAACTPAPTNAPPAVVEADDSAASGASDPPTPGPTASYGVTAGPVEYPGPDGQMLTGFLARPAGDEPAPGVILIQEWWGLNDHIKDVTSRLAAEGFVVLAPDLYHGQVVSEPDEARKLVMELDMANAVLEIQSAVDHLQSRDEVAGTEVGVMGFCMGGRLTLQTALVEDDLGAAIAFYGAPVTPEQAPEIKAPLLGLYGELDQGIPVDDIDAMSAALDAAGIEHAITVYPGAEHAFFNDTRESYNPEAAADAWAQTLGWLRTHLGG